MPVAPGGRDEVRAPKSGDQTEPFPDWLIRMTRPGIDLDPALDANRAR